MATDSSFLKRLEQPEIGIREQYLALKQFCPGTVVITDNDKTVRWEGTLQPTPFSSLYLPAVKQKNKVSEWQPTMFVANTILPWASMWLLYFEFWLFNGKWDGGGVEHDVIEERGR